MKRLGWKGWLIAGLALVVLLVILSLVKEPAGTEVEAERVKRRTILARVSESGVIQPDVEVPIAPDVSGEVISVHVKEGDFVHKGDLLFTIRPDNLRAALDQSSAALSSSRADYENSKAALQVAISNVSQDSVNFVRQKVLYEQKAIPRTDFENARLKYAVDKAQVESNRAQMMSAFYRIQSAQASVSQASTNLSRTSVYASMDGTVTKMAVQVGQRLVGTGTMAGTEVMKVADLTDMEVQVDINENDIVNLQLGDTATIEVDAYPDYKFKGQVTEIGYAANVTATGSTDQITNYPVRVAILPESYLHDKKIMANLKPTQGPFRPGMSALVSVYTDRADSVLSLPIQAVTLDRSKQSGVGKPGEVVFVLQPNSTVKANAVKTGISDENYIEIRQGLAEADSVVVGPYTVVNKTMQEGMRVVAKKQTRGKKGPNAQQGPPKP